jgi:hypothetical protein
MFVLSCLEGVSQDELEYRMLCESSNEDEWDKQIVAKQQEMTKKKKDQLTQKKRY